ncbi:MAG TPA: LemA family protein [Candidatus Thermoplasmatota archaeon]|nr:LemA family protein [Candidatus Thermoplasmatota archaeon]
MAIDRKWIILGAVGLVVLLLLIGTVSAYNSLVQERQGVETQGKQVDVQYQRAFTLLPQIQDLAQQYLRNESAVQTKVAALRSGACASPQTINEKDQCSSQVTETGNLIIKVVNEDYPDLKSVTLYQNVQTETINTANKVATEKGRYNEKAGAYNAHIQKCCLPALTAGLFGFHKAELIGYSDRPDQSSFPSGQPL